MEVLLKRVRERPAPPHELVSGLTAEVSEVILTMMAREPDERYQSAEELRDALPFPIRKIQVDNGTEWSLAFALRWMKLRTSTSQTSKWRSVSCPPQAQLPQSRT